MFKKLSVVLIAGVLSSCGAPDTLTPTEHKVDPETAFVEVVREEIPVLEEVSDEILIETAKDTCDAMRSLLPLSEGELVGMAQGFSEGTEGEMTVRESAYFLGAAAAVFCPDVSEQIEDLSGEPG